MQGTIKRIVQDRGFGFLRGDGEHTDMFFHVRNLASDLAFDEQLVERRIEFETQQSAGDEQREENAVAQRDPALANAG